jgi:multidrug efflux pump subunit AcrB
MSHHQNDDHIVAHTHNTARFFTESRHIAWVLLITTCLWGVFGYWKMPQRKDPEIPIRQAAVLIPWPGQSAEKIEQLVTRKVEQRISENARVEKITSNTRTNIAAIYITLVQEVDETGKEFDDIKMKLDAIDDLPEGAGPIQFLKDFGDTAALMLTVSSPKLGATEIGLRAQAIRTAIEQVRANAPGTRTSLVLSFPTSISPNIVRQPAALLIRTASDAGIFADARTIEGPGFFGIDAGTSQSETEIQQFLQTFIRDNLRAAEMHPDVWPIAVISDPAETPAKLTAVASDKYSYRELDDYTELIARSLRTLPIVSKVTRSGLLEERIYLSYSQERIAAYGVSASELRDALNARNITGAGGLVEVGAKNLTIDPSGELKSAADLESILIPTSNGKSVYLRDLVDITRSYVSPPQFLNFLGTPAEDGWSRTRAITVAVQMKSGAQIGDFSIAVDAGLEDIKRLLPEDLVLARTSDQPRQVEENVHLFMNSLYEAVFLVVLVSLIGFWEWRSALLMALSIPITLAMTFGMMYAVGMDLQQISIGSLIIALGLLVDDPVVAGDAIKRDLAAGHKPIVAAWLGPTKLANAILFATITNIVAYLPFLLLTGDMGRFMYSLPVVVGASLVASRIVSMTFIPLLGYYLLRPKAEPTIEERRKSGFAAWYYRFGTRAIEHRWRFLAASLVLLVGGFYLGANLRNQYFPTDLQYLSYVDVWLPEDAPLSATAETVARVEGIIRHVAGEYGKHHANDDGSPKTILKSLTTFVGGGGPRFWFSVSPEMSQLNYAQVLIEVFDKHDTHQMAPALQEALSTQIPGARVDVRLLESGAAFGIPVSVRFSGESVEVLRQIGAEATEILRGTPYAVRIRDTWGPESFTVQLKTDSDRANLSGFTNMEIAASSVAGMNGVELTTLREGDKQIPIVARMRMEQRSSLSDLQNLYVYSSRGPQRIPLQAVSTIDYGMHTEKLERRNQFRTIAVGAYAADGHYPSEVLNAAMPALRQLEKSLPPGYWMEIGGEYEEQNKGFADLAMVMGLSIAMIFLALVVQFKHAIKPFVVFAAIPYGIAGALATLWLMGSPFGFMAFLGIASLIGVIVSHIIVLFDFIEEMHERGMPLEEALLNAGIMRLRPVLITVAATVIALFPLAAHGGPLWEPLCYAQIGGLTIATFVTLVIVPVIYAVAVKDLKIVKWEAKA